MTSNRVAIVVLGARVLSDGQPGAALLRRIERAATAWHDRLAPIVLCSGGRSWSGHVEAIVMRNRLLELDVDPRAAWLEPDSLSTAENARACTRILRREGFERVVVVSCHWHLQRALANFRLCGMPAVALAARPGPRSLPQKAWRHVVERGCEVIDRGRLTLGDLQ